MAKFITAKEAAELIQDGAVLGSAVQGMTGWPEEIGLAIEKRFLETGHPANITHIHGAGQGDFGRRDPEGKKTRGEDVLAHDGLLSCSIHGHVGCSFKMVQQIHDNKILAYNIPLGVVGQIWREQGRGFPGLLSKVGLGTFIDPRVDGARVNEKTKKEGKQIIKYIPDLNGEEYLLYTLPPLNVALLRATTSDEDGDLTYEKECMPCEPLDLALAAKAAGAIVIAQVERVAKTGSLDPRTVKIPGFLVDYVVVAEHPERIMQTHITHFNPAFTGEIRIPMEGAKQTVPFDFKKVIARRTAMEFRKGNKCNFGIGMPGLVPNILMEEGVDAQVMMLSESGLVGGIPAQGGDFGAHFNPIAMVNQTDFFSFFDQGGLDIGVFGLPEVDKLGNVNTTNLNGKIAGVGGFPNISANAKHSIFMGTITASGFQCHIENGRLVIDHEGKFNKFVDTCVQTSFNAEQCLHRGNRITYITERCVFERCEEGMVLTEIAPGIDVERDIIGHMGFKPIIPEGGPKVMNSDLFFEDWGKLKEIF